MTRDISEKQFVKSLAKYGIKPVGFHGYHAFKSPTTQGALHVSVAHIRSRREKLSYLLRAQRQYEEREWAEKKWNEENADDIALWNQLKRGITS
jgi:hypothetical protein